MRKGSKMTLESRQKMSASRTGKPSNHTGCKHSEDSCKKMSQAHIGQKSGMKGKKHSVETRLHLSSLKQGTVQSESHRQHVSVAITNAWQVPEKRKRMLDRCRWKNTSADKGQLELLKKWESIGFKFEPNYRIKTDVNLFYIDGYDSTHNVVLEYDGKYHSRTQQQKKDVLRQQKIIDILKPKKFWRYNAVTKTFRNVLEG
jgi:very-short-patch-repair endonuclease